MKTAFRDVKETIRRRIIEGVWAPGDLLPNEVDLAAGFGCARTTVNRAMRELADEGLIERKRKAGTRVRMAPLRQARFHIPIVREEIEGTGSVYRYALLSRTVIPAPKWLGARLKLSGAARVLHLTCEHQADAHPYQYEDRWINLGALPEAEDADFSVTGPNEWLVGEVPFSDAEISFAATAADNDLAQHLRCARGDPLFLSERTTWWKQEAITYVRLVFARGHKMTTRY